jgi:CPA1 family monovalent cation:H+ antiporter
MRDLLNASQNTDALIEVTISLMTPFAAYLAADLLGVSTILAVVAAGLYSGWRDPLRMDVETRRVTWSVWSAVLFWLNGLAFILLGLQFPSILATVSGRYSTSEILLAVAAVTGVAVAARLLWMFPGALLSNLAPKRLRTTESAPSWQELAVTGWAGMRGTITLAAALSIPHMLPDGTPFPARDIVIFLSFGVIVSTLLLQGTTLEALICKLGLRADDTREKEDRLARIAAVEGGLNHLRAAEARQATAADTSALALIIAEYEHRLAELTAEGETRAQSALHRKTGRRHRLDALHAERSVIDDLWRRDVITDETHRPLQQLLDYEEAMLAAQSVRDTSNAP